MVRYSSVPQSWRSFFAAGTPGWEDSVAERQRRLALQRVLASIRSVCERISIGRLVGYANRCGSALYAEWLTHRLIM